MKFEEMQHLEGAMPPKSAALQPREEREGVRAHTNTWCARRALERGSAEDSPSSHSISAH